MTSASLFDPNVPIPGNYYAPQIYVQSDLESGLLMSRHGERLLALPAALIRGIYSGLEYETGQAARLVLRHCGQMWGKEFFRRFARELSDFYQKPLAQLEMGLFIQNLQQAWKTHGWGLLSIDWSHKEQGILIVTIQNSAFDILTPLNVNRPMGFLEAGLLATWFSQLTGRELACIQTSSEVLGANENLFVITTQTRLKEGEAWVDAGLSHAEILNKLLTELPVS
ncbi:MAG: 4-vinyl reductase [Cyanobacteriota bacterium]|nr:4-vinyl reductase [Cyanobacteriota bacterium]